MAERVASKFAASRAARRAVASAPLEWIRTDFERRAKDVLLPIYCLPTTKRRTEDPNVTIRRALLLAISFLTGACAGPKPAPAPFTIVEASIAEMTRAMQEGRVTSRELVLEYLARIATYEDPINAVITVNPHAIEEAEALDRERASGKVRGPLHGIPVALKDNIQTKDLSTTGGALAFLGYRPPYDATLVEHLREAGAIIIAKTVLSELANWVAGDPTPMPGNYNAVSGFAFNPYDPRRDPRERTNDGRPAMSTGGSSSGAGTTANFWAANVGTDTSGSVVNPSNLTMLVGIRPTLGRISRYGIIPITLDQDTAGPMARTVADAALLLGVLEGGAPDPNDPATETCSPPPERDYTAYLNRDGLKGARIGIPRAYYYDERILPGEEKPRGGLGPEQAKVMADAIDVLKREGAILIDPADIPSVLDSDPKNNPITFDTCAGADEAKGKDDDCSIVFKYGMKRDFDAWLETLGDTAPVKSLTELRNFNLAHAKGGAIRYGQSRLDISDEMDLEKDRARYLADRRKDVEMGRTRGLEAVIQEHQLDALLIPGWIGAGIASKAGYPIINVPFGMIPNAPASQPFPEDFEAKPMPYGVSFTGLACSEPRLIELAYAFEQATKRRAPPVLP
jgi:amidase